MPVLHLSRVFYYLCLIALLPLSFSGIVNAQNIDPSALDILKSSIKKVEDIDEISCSIFYSYSRGDEKNVFVADMGVTYITMLNKDSVMYYLPPSIIKLDTKDSVYMYYDHPSHYISVLSKKEYYTHGTYTIEKINISDLLPRNEDLEEDFIDSIVFYKGENQDEYIIDEIHKLRVYNNV